MHRDSLHTLTVEPIPRLALRRPEAAEALGVSERTLAGWGDVPTVRIGGCVMYPVEPLRDWLAHQTQNKSNTTTKSETATTVEP